MSKFAVPIRLLDIGDNTFRDLYFKNNVLKSKLSVEEDVVLNRTLEGLSVAIANTPIVTSDTVIQAFSKLQTSINYILTSGGFTQIQSDWNQANNLAVDFIKNKPTNVSAFVNDVGYVVGGSIPTALSELTNDVGFITLADVPPIPTDISDLTDVTGIIPTDTSDLTNGAGFITMSDIPPIPSDTSDLTNGAGFITLSDIPFIPTDISDLTDNTGIIPTNDTQIALSATYTGNLVGQTTVSGAMGVLDAFVGGSVTTLLSSNALTFDAFYQYGTPASSRTGDITVSFTDAKLGVVQTMFHDDAALPAEILSNSKFVVLQGYYEPNTVNRISFELIDTTLGSEVILVTVIPTE